MSSEPRHITLAAGLGLAILLLLPGAPAQANPLDAFGFGSRSIGLGGAVTAAVDDFSANYYNPAALATQKELRLEFGYIFTKPELTINGGDLEVDENRGFQGGVVLPGTILGKSVAVSLGLFIPDERLTRIRSLPESQPRFVLYDNRPQRVVISSSLGIEVLEGLYLGAGLTFLANTFGTLHLTGDVDFLDAEQTTLFTATDVDLAAVRYLTAGLLYHHGPHWRFGLTFRDEFRLRLDLGVDVNGQILSGGQPIFDEPQGLGVTTLNTNLFSPRQVALGVAFEGEGWLLGLDFTWIQWSRFPPPTSRIEIELNLDLPPDLVSVPGAVLPEPTMFRDILVPRVGAEMTVVDTHHVDLQVRGGLFIEPSPAPSQPGITNYVDNHKVGLSAGLGLALEEWTAIFPKPVVLDLTGQLIQIPTRTYTKDDPADPIGDYQASGQFFGVSATAKLLF